jgi:hypothetical protein
MAEYNLNPAEKDSEVSWYKALGAGLLSGAIKVPEGIVSLGAELIDLGADSDLAGDVEEFFDKINPFEEVAEERLIGKLTESIIQIGVPGGIGFKVANKAARSLTSKALKAKRSDAYAQFGKTGKTPDSDKLQTSLKKVRDLNKKSKYPRYSVAVGGGAVGEMFVVDNDEIGTFGDMFEGPTELDRSESYGREDATRKLMNRLRFGTESLFITPAVYGVGKTAKLLAQRGKELAYSESKFQRAIDKYIRAPFQPRGKMTQEIFESEMLKQGLKARDSRRANEIINNITKSLDGILPTIQEVGDKGTKSNRDIFLQKVNDLLVGGDIEKKIDVEKLESVIKELDMKNVPKEKIKELVKYLDDGRNEFNNLVDILKRTSKNAKGATTEFQNLFNKQLSGYAGNTFKIFETKSSIFNGFRTYQPTEESYTAAVKVFKDTLGATENQSRQIIDDILEQASKIKKPKDLPEFNFVQKTMEKGKPKFIERSVGLARDQAGTAAQKKALKELFGEIKDPRFTILNSMNSLSYVARTSDMFNQIVLKNQAVQKAGGRGFFWADDKVAEAAVNKRKTGIEIVKMSDVLGEIDGLNGITNPISNLYTTREIAEGIKASNDVLSGLQGFVRGTKEMSGSEKVVSWFYRNLLLLPKGISQMSKTIFSIPTHVRNFMSAGAFTAANGVLFDGITNPKLLGKAFQDGIDTSALLKLGPGSAKAQQRYQDLLELGVVNSQVQMGDLISLLKDTNAGSTMMGIDGPLGRMFKGLKKVGKVFQDKYTAEDDTFKITNFVVELERLKTRNAKRLGISLDDYKKQLDLAKKGKNQVIDRNSELWKLQTEAAQIVKNTVPNYAYVGDVVKTSRLLPIGNFMSFPSEIIRTSANIAQQGLREMRHQLGEGAVSIKGSNLTPTVTEILKDGTERVVRNSSHVDGSFGTGFKRLMGMATTLTGVPIAVTEGAKALYDVTSEEIDAMRRFVPEWSKNSTLVPVRSDDGELRYVDFSKSNAYDVMARPFRTIINNLIDGDKNDETILKSFSDGVAEATGEIMDPFISESIFTEAMFDLTLRNGRTDDGRLLYTDQTSAGDKLAIQFNHLSKAILPNKIPYERLASAAMGTVTERGEELNIGPELAGFMGLRAIKIDPLRTMNFKVNEYQRGIREARREFTGGAFGVLKGGPVSAEEIIERYIASNKARFNVQKNMFRDIEAAQILDTRVSDLRRLFKDRQISNKNFNNLLRGRFDIYYPSKDIIDKFRETSRALGESNPFIEARTDINSIKRDFRNLGLDTRFRTQRAVGGHIQEAMNDQYDVSAIIDKIAMDISSLNLKDEFNIKLTDYIQPATTVNAPPLPMQPMPSAQILQPQAPGNITAQGLTPTELALLSPEEQQIRLRQRGLA